MRFSTLLLLAALGFCALAIPLPGEHREATPSRVVLAALLGLALSLPWLFVSWFAFYNRCDENCYGGKLGWHGDAQAWQWTAQLVLATVGVVILALAVRLFLRGARFQRAFCWAHLLASYG